MRTKVFILAMLTSIAILLTGCWDAKELDELGISLIIGLDMEEEKVLLTAGVIEPVTLQTEDGNKGATPIKYTQGTGNNILEAFRDINLKFDKQIFTAHNKVIIFGEDFAKEGLATLIDELFRDREQRETAYLLVAKGSKAYEVMGIDVGIEQIPALYILDMIKNVKRNPKTTDTNFIEYLKSYYHQGHHPITGIIEKKEKSQIGEVGGNGKKNQYELSVLGTAVFKEDILKGYLNGNDTKAVNFILDKVRGGIITFPTPMGEEESPKVSNPINEGLSSVVIIKNRIKNDVEIVDGKIILKTKIKLRGSMGEVVGNIDISKGQNIKKMEGACSKAAEEGIKNAVKKVQENFGLDVFGFGMVFHRKYPKEWKNIKDDWDEIFSEADFQIEVKTNIIRTGLINAPINRKEVD